MLIWFGNVDHGRIDSKHAIRFSLLCSRTAQGKGLGRPKEREKKKREMEGLHGRSFEGLFKNESEAETLCEDRYGGRVVSGRLSLKSRDRAACSMLATHKGKRDEVR